MQIEQAATPPPPPAHIAVRRPPEPPTWLLIALGVAYIVALAGLVFFPGASLMDRLRALDGGVCAQLPSHSYFPDNDQLPLCARCTGMYLGFACTFLVLWARGRLRSAQLPGKWAAIILGLAVLFLAEDGFNSLFNDLGLPHLYQPLNWLRLATGLGTGAAMAAFILPIANTLIWRHEDERPSFASLRQLALLAPVLLLAFAAVNSQPSILLYPIAVLSSAGLVVALSLVNTVFILGIGNRAGRFATVRQFFPVYTAAVVLAVIELMALFAVKSSLMPSLAPVR